ncbi:MAG: peptidoglycan-binding protein [Myxococcales bacterium]|nr:peptidoglycan-binding protein [Myxococcota bacterium]MDW8284292.1 peptidoglycan-binding protein [Myxococcales bacterium]
MSALVSHWAEPHAPAAPRGVPMRKADPSVDSAWSFDGAPGPPAVQCRPDDTARTPQDRSLKNPLFQGDAKLQAVADGKTTIQSGSGLHIKKVQTALVNLGYALPIYGADGSFGGETQVALKQFQVDAGMAPSGALDQPTMVALDARAPTTPQTKYPDYGEMFKDGLLDATIGVGYDEDGSFDSEIDQIHESLIALGFTKKGPEEAKKLYAKAGMTPPEKGEGDYYIKEKALVYDDKDIAALVRVITYKDPEAKQAFLEAMQNSDLSMYTGHGRYGSGPDFDHKDRGEGNIWINPDATVKDPGTGAMYEKLKKQRAEQPLPTIDFSKKYKVWLFDGCNTKHYLKPIRAKAGIDHRKTDVFGWGTEISISTTAEDVLEFLQGIMQMESAQELVERLNKLNGIKQAGEGLQAEGFGDNPTSAGRRGS